MARVRMIALRPLRPDDRTAFQAFVRGLSLESRLHRFLFPVQELAPSLLEALTNADQSRHLALAAVEGSTIVGESRCVALGDSGRAEMAIAVADAWQRQGIGARLLGALMAAARNAGVRILEGEVLRTNTAMLRFVQREGFRLGVCLGDARLATVERPL